jgi:hypothetical protein
MPGRRFEIIDDFVFTAGGVRYFQAFGAAEPFRGTVLAGADAMKASASAAVGSAGRAVLFPNPVKLR